MLVLHTRKVDYVELGHRDDDHGVEVFHESEASFVDIVLYERRFAA